MPETGRSAGTKRKMRKKIRSGDHLLRIIFLYLSAVTVTGVLIAALFLLFAVIVILSVWVFLDLMLLPLSPKRGSEEHRGVNARNYADDHRQREAHYRGNASQRADYANDYHNAYCGNVCVDISRNGLRYREVGKFLNIQLLAVKALVFADTVVDYDGRVYRVAHDGEQYRDEVRVYIEAEDYERAVNHYHIVQQTQHRESTCRDTADISKSDADVDYHYYYREKQRHKALSKEGLAVGRRNVGRFQSVDLVIGISFLKLILYALLLVVADAVFGSERELERFLAAGEVFTDGNLCNRCN